MTSSSGDSKKSECTSRLKKVCLHGWLVGIQYHPCFPHLNISILGQCDQQSQHWQPRNWCDRLRTNLCTVIASKTLKIIIHLWERNVKYQYLTSEIGTSTIGIIIVRVGSPKFNQQNTWFRTHSGVEFYSTFPSRIQGLFIMHILLIKKTYFKMKTRS